MKRKLIRLLFSALLLGSLLLVSTVFVSAEPEPKADGGSVKQFSDAAEKKWETLSDEEKDAIYALRDKVLQAQKALVDQYAKSGVIDTEIAEEIKEHMDDFAADCKANRLMPDFRFPHHNALPKNEKSA